MGYLVEIHSEISHLHTTQPSRGFILITRLDEETSSPFLVTIKGDHTFNIFTQKKAVYYWVKKRKQGIYRGLYTFVYRIESIKHKLIYKCIDKGGTTYGKKWQKVSKLLDRHRGT